MYLSCVPPRRGHQLIDEPLLVDTLFVELANSVRDLTFYLDFGRKHVDGH